MTDSRKIENGGHALTIVHRRWDTCAERRVQHLVQLAGRHRLDQDTQFVSKGNEFDGIIRSERVTHAFQGVGLKLWSRRRRGIGGATDWLPGGA